MDNDIQKRLQQIKEQAAKNNMQFVSGGTPETKPQEEPLQNNDFEMKKEAVKESKEVAHIKPASERREKKIMLRLTDSEHDQLTESAKKIGVTISTYCRNIVLNAKAGNIYIDEEFKRNLVNIGNNLNQLTTHYNRTGERPPAEMEELKNLITVLKNAYRKQ